MPVMAIMSICIDFGLNMAQIWHNLLNTKSTNIKNFVKRLTYIILYIIINRIYLNN